MSIQLLYISSSANILHPKVPKFLVNMIDPTGSSGMQTALKICPDTGQVCGTFQLTSWSLAKGHPIPDASDSLHLLANVWKQSISSSPRQASEESHRCKPLDTKYIKARKQVHKNRYQRGSVQNTKSVCYMWLSQDQVLRSVPGDLMYLHLIQGLPSCTVTVAKYMKLHKWWLLLYRSHD